MDDRFELLMISAMYENGGNTTHRFLDGHRELYVYPFESQLGTVMVHDKWTSVFPVKYRWPEFPLDGTPASDFGLFIDEECRIRARTPHVSKFRHVAFEFSDDERAAAYQARVGSLPRSRAGNVAAFFGATFDAWKNRNRSGSEHVHVGYSPIVVVDTEKIVADLPGAHVVHVVRNPWSAYADTKKRPAPLGLADYMAGWILNQYHGLLFSRLYPSRVHLVRIEDVLSDPVGTLGGLCAAIGIGRDDRAVNHPSFNGLPLAEVYPWGTIRSATPEANRATAGELSVAEYDAIRERAWQYLDVFDYSRFAQR